MVTTDKWEDKQSGELREATEWHSIIFSGRLAECGGQYLRKGSQVYVEGSLRTRKWIDQSGVERFSTDIRTDQLQMLDTRQGCNEQGGYPPGLALPPRAKNARRVPFPRAARSLGF